MYVCMYVYMYLCMYVCMYVYMYVCMYVHMYVCMYVCLCVGIGKSEERYNDNLYINVSLRGLM